MRETFADAPTATTNTGTVHRSIRSPIRASTPAPSPTVAAIVAGNAITSVVVDTPKTDRSASTSNGKPGRSGFERNGGGAAPCSAPSPLAPTRLDRHRYFGVSYPTG